VRSHRVVYASNHKSHTDYLVEPLVLDDNGIRPPLIVAGINLFGGPLGLIHKHVTGAIPIRRATKDPAYLITLKAYVAEILKKHDLFFYPEGGRSYSGELKASKTGLFNAALGAERPDLVIIPVAVAYDLVLEDHILAHQSVKKRQRPFGREVAEMVRYAVGYRSRAFVTFGAPITAGDRDVHSRSDVLELARHVRALTGALYKVLPDGGVRGGDAAVDHAAGSRIAHRPADRGAGRAPRQPRRDQRTPGDRRGGRAARNPRHRGRRTRALPRARTDGAAVLREDDRAPPRDDRPDPLMVDSVSKALFHLDRSKRNPQEAGVAVRHAPALELRAPVHRRRDGRDAIAAARAVEARGMLISLDLLGESVATLAAADVATRAISTSSTPSSPRGSSATSR
jgi:1-acyl-sn-glycerol-3-phosphate acyltransferase